MDFWTAFALAAPRQVSKMAFLNQHATLASFCHVMRRDMDFSLLARESGILVAG